MTVRRLATGLGAAAALLAAGCGGSSHVPCPHGRVVFGVEPYGSGVGFKGAYTQLAQQLTPALGCPVQIHIAKSTTDEIAALRSGKLDLAEISARGYVFAHRMARAEPLATFGDSHGNADAYYAGIWVKKGSPITSLAGLRGKTLALADPASTSGSMYPLNALSSSGLV